MRVVEPAGSLPSSDEPRRSEMTGLASTRIRSQGASREDPGLTATKPAQRAQWLDSWPSPSSPPASRRRSFLLSTRTPMKPNIAGSRVIAAAMVKATMSTDAYAMPLRKPMRSTSRPSSAMQTVPPAKRTARPEVLRERTAESSVDVPALRPSRCLVTMNSA